MLVLCYDGSIEGDSRLVTVEGSNEGKVITLHNNSRREQQGEANGLGIQPERVSEAQLMLPLCGSTGLSMVGVTLELIVVDDFNVS